MYVVLQGMPCCDYVVICTCNIRYGGRGEGAMMEIAPPLCVTYTSFVLFHKPLTLVHTTIQYGA